ncbi:MAG: ATP-binding protein [Verrucomicrobiae bacterium]|nr:ATP-binding protein [Verrucomicrobiae bacterium]
MRTVFWLLFLAAVPQVSFGLDPAKSLYQFNCKSWGRQNGLPAGVINAIKQTPDGYIWLGTARGLVRFDGVEFKLFELDHCGSVQGASVSCLAGTHAHRGGLWFGLEYGTFGYFEGDAVKFVPKGEWVTQIRRVHGMLETRAGDLWIAAETMAGRVTRGNIFERVLARDTDTERFDTTAIYEDTRGRIFLGTVKRGVYVWSNGALTQLKDPVFDNLIVRAFAEDKHGNIWMGTDWGLLCFDRELNRIEFPFPWHPVRALLVDRHGALWIGTSGGGLVRYHNGKLAALRQANGLADDFVTALAEDAEGSLWVGTRNGLTQVSDVKIPIFGPAEGVPASVVVTVSSTRNGGLMLACNTGVVYVDDPDAPFETARHYSKDAGLSNTYITLAYEARDGNLYLADGDMTVLVLTEGKVVARYPNKTWPVAFAEDEKSVLVAIGGKIHRVGRTFFEPYAFRNGTDPGFGWIYHMAPGRDGSIWIAGDIGFCRLKDGAFELWTHTNGVPPSKARWIVEDTTGTVWVGLETAGILRLKDGKVRQISSKNGLADDVIIAMVPDDHGRLWVDSARGIFSVSLAELNRYADGEVQTVNCVTYDTLDSVKGTEKFEQIHSGCKTADGRIWFPTAHGVAMIDPARIARNPVPPRVHIQRVRANGKELENLGYLVAPPGDGELEVHYAALSYIAPHKIQYRYKLDGFDKDWVNAGHRRAAIYTNLKPGTYRFHVQACNEDGVWSNDGDVFEIWLKPWFYQTGWFKTVVAGAVLLGLFGVTRWRDWRVAVKQQKLKEAHDRLEAEVARRTRELAETNEALKSEIEERKRAEVQVERIYMQLLRASRLAGIAEVASSVLHNVGNVLNSVNVSASIVVDRVRRFPVQNLVRALQLLQDNKSRLAEFLTSDSRGRMLPEYLAGLADVFAKEQEALLNELKDLMQKVEHMKETISLQQSSAKIAGTREIAALSDIVEIALKLHANAYSRHGIQVERDYEDVPKVIIDKHKVLQILVNLLHNAKYACDEGGRADKKVIVRIKRGNQGFVRIEVTDNGIGIPPENLTRIFEHGFTTRKDGHGFGLYSSAMAARELGGTLTAYSEGVGKGATFVLEVPIEPPHENGNANAAQPPRNSSNIG